LLENKTYPWMAALPDGDTVVVFKEDENIVAPIEIKIECHQKEFNMQRNYQQNINISS